MFKKLISFAAWALFLCVLLIACVIACVISERTFLHAFALWLIVIVVILCVRFIWGLVSSVTQEKYIDAVKAKFKLTRLEYVLYEHWKTGASVIKRIRRRRQPIPWFVLTGGRSGKTTLMAGAGLPLFSNEPESSLVVPTRTLRWWFFRSAGFLDLSSHFLNKTPAFERGWLRLVKWCGRLPAPAGIVVCVSVSELLEKNDADLHLHARHIRTQIEPLVSKVKRRLPVYLFITCCDRVPGFSHWASQLSAAQRQQPLGYYWRSSPIVDGKDPALLDPLFTCVKDGLDKVRVSMLSGGEPDADTLALMDFPEQLPQLQPALQRYLAALCEPDAYFQPAALGGVWFTATEPVSKNSATREAFFIHDLMTRLLPMLSRQREVEPVGFGRVFLHKWGAITFSALAISGVLMSGYFTGLLTQGTLAKMDVAAQVQQLENIEGWSNHPLRYLPFLPVLNQRHTQLEASILAATPRDNVNLQALADSYEQQFMQATAPQKRDLILTLANTLISKQAMWEKQPVSELLKQAQVPAALSMTGATVPLPHQQDVVLQRALLQQPQGEQQLKVLRQLLGRLVNSDPQMAWLEAPSDELTPVNLTDFLPLSDDKTQVSGLWTQQGTDQIQGWMAQIRRAGGGKIPMPELAAFDQRWPALRQTQWMTLMLAMNQQSAPALSQEQWQTALIALDQGNSPSMKFARYVNEQLEDISTQDAALWLRELRRLNQLQAMPSAGARVPRISQVQQFLHKKMSAWLKIDSKTLPPVLSDLDVKNWNTWKSGLHAAVSDVFATPKSSDRLTRGLFQTGASGDNNPLQLLDSRFNVLRKSLSAQPDDFATNAVWTLYQSDAQWLVANAMQRSACWLQQQWQSRVLWPMENNASRLEYDDQQDLAWQYLSDFIRGPAKSVLVVEDAGPKAGEFNGQTPGLTAEFLRMVNHVLRPDDVLAMPERENTRHDDALAALKDEQNELEDEMAALEAKPLEVTLKSLPATIPGGARLMPVGTRLTLFCDEQQWKLNSMNFSEQASFRWRPGHCSRATLVVNFPGFDLTYEYFGDAAWPDFLRDMSEGQHRFSAEDFPEQAAQLATLGIKEVMVRYQTGSQDPVQESWQQWQTLNQTLNDNIEAQQEAGSKKTEKQRPSALKSAFSQLPVRITECH
ncbi:type VI secretion protein IcmF/TssM N-terminal domain-containing protein [Buttiauxella sp.]|uniref:type VI secretion protein IcmF/TssM N-terminal domain-containing protein n=1 Tax=Buttiauxella sp. TaxID=1972222 RepID=UPI003C72C039